MPRRILAVLLACAAVGLSACTTESSGVPAAAVPDTSTTTASADPLSSVDPCTLVSASDVASSQLKPGYSIPAAGGRGCRWDRPDDGATTDGYMLQVVIYDHAGEAQLNTTGSTVSDTSVGSYHGRLLQDTPLNICLISLATTSTSRIDIALDSAQGMAKSCSLAEEAAPVIVSHLPAGK